MSRASDWAMDLKSARYREPESLAYKTDAVGDKIRWLKARVSETGDAMIEHRLDDPQGEYGGFPIMLSPDAAVVLGTWLLLNFKEGVKP